MGIGLIEREVKVADQLAAGLTLSTLHDTFPRGQNEYWLVAHAPISLGERIQWGPVRDGEYVHIPLIPYRTHTDANKAIKYAITLGLRAGLDINVIPGRDIKQLCLVTGTVAEDLRESEGIEAIRFYLGLAIQIN
jgi:hypothetical protein